MLLVPRPANARRLLLLSAFALPPVALLSCGYVGEPLPPALNIPRAVTDLKANQRGDKILLEFTIPELTTEGLPIKLGSIELRAGAWDNQPFDEEAWYGRARTVQTGCVAPGPCRAETPARAWTGSEAFFRVRLLNPRGRAGDWSDFVVVRVIPPLEPPFGLSAEAAADGVRLAWQGPRHPPGVAFRVRRLAGDQQAAVVVATVAGWEWTDTATEYGTRYEYSLQAVAKAGESVAESEISEPVAIIPEDRFPPSVPAGLTALAGPESIELAWERSAEPDLAGYFVHRAAGDEPFQKITTLLAAPSYSDREVEHGQTYRYAVSSADRLGNESEHSQPVEITLP